MRGVHLGAIGPIGLRPALPVIVYWCYFVYSCVVCSIVLCFCGGFVVAVYVFKCVFYGVFRSAIMRVCVYISVCVLMCVCSCVCVFKR